MFITDAFVKIKKKPKNPMKRMRGHYNNLSFGFIYFYLFIFIYLFFDSVKL